jgi:hypothetical protein
MTSTRGLGGENRFLHAPLYHDTSRFPANPMPAPADICGADICGTDICGTDICGTDICGIDHDHHASENV